MPTFFTGNETLNESALVDLLRDPGFVDFFRGGPRVFNYAAVVAATDAGCAQSFNARKFIHHDWVDGQDVVQAGRTPDNDGFNYLFHNLEADLEAVKADITTLFGCLARLRQQLSARLDEIRTELNRLDSDVWTLTPNKSLISKIPPNRFVGVTKIGNQQLAVLRNDDGSFQTMELKLDTSVITHPQIAIDRVGNAASFAGFAASNPAVSALFVNHTPTTAEVLAKVGNETLDNGKKVADVLAGLPANATFKSTTELSDAVADHEGAVVRSSTDATVTKTSLGVDATTGSAANASIQNVGTIDAVTKAKLDAAGIKTVNDLSNADPARLTTITGNAADALRLRATGRTFKGVG